MLATHTLVFALGAFLSLPQITLGGLVQVPNLALPSSSNAAANQNAIRQIFTDSYAVYQTFASGHDEVAPISKTIIDSRNGWGASMIDGLDTMLIMGLNDLFSQSLTRINAIDFSKSVTSDSVSVFESTIRYIGGLLSAYEMSNLQHPVLLQKATQLADKLAFAWVGDASIPFGHIAADTNSPVTGTSNIAEAGSLTMEWGVLSKYTHNDTYRVLGEKPVRHIAQLSSPLPGLAAQGIDPQTGNFVGGYVSWGGGSDSYFEYLIKYARLSNAADPIFANTWKQAVDSSIRTLLHTSTAGDFSYLADYDSSKEIRHVGSHLACFYGGNWLLGGKLLNNATIVNVGLQLVDSCWNTYASTATGIGPEIFAFNSKDGNFTGGSTPTEAQDDFYSQHGFYITAPDYILRPEVLESNFYAWRVTGESKYLDRAAQAVTSFQKYLKVDSGGYAGITDVTNNSEGRGRDDDTQSFWFAEVLKYLYLTFDDPSHISLDEYVFNTEGHPFKASGSNFGTRSLNGRRGHSRRSRRRDF